MRSVGQERSLNGPMPREKEKKSSREKAQNS